MEPKKTSVKESLENSLGFNAYKHIYYSIEPVNPIKAALANCESVKERIEVLQDKILQMPQADIHTAHEFEHGKYIRTITAPPSCVIVGAEHKTPYKVILKKGTLTVNIGTDVKTLTAPAEFYVPVGEQRIGYTFDEVIWSDVYENPDNCTNIDTLEERLYVIPECGMYDWRKRNGLLHLGEQKCLEQ